MWYDSRPNVIAPRKFFRTKHVVAAGLFARDAGSTPAASTRFYRYFYKIIDITGKQRENKRMKTKAKRPVTKPDGFPKRLKEGNAEVTIYLQSNPSRIRNPETGSWERTGKVFDEYVLAYY